MSPSKREGRQILAAFAFLLCLRKECFFRFRPKATYFPPQESRQRALGGSTPKPLGRSAGVPFSPMRKEPKNRPKGGYTPLGIPPSQSGCVPLFPASGTQRYADSSDGLRPGTDWLSAIFRTHQGA